MKRKRNTEINNNIKDFWKWFESNKDVLKSNKLNNDVLQILNEKILSLGDFNWEVREGKEKENMLILSSGGDVDLLPLTKNIINSAPILSEWEFYFYKPAKDWDYKFYVEEFDKKKMIDASSWEYVLLQFPDSSYDIIIKAPSLAVLPKDEQYDIFDIVLENILGEEISLKLIKNVDIVDAFSNDDINQKGNIKELKNHIFELENMISS